MKKANIILILIAIIALTCFYGCNTNKEITNVQINRVISTVSNPDKSPKTVFLSAWNTIREEYLDRSFNHQNWTKWKNRYENNIKTKKKQINA